MANFKVRLNQIGSDDYNVEFAISKAWLDEVLVGTDVRTASDAAPGRIALRLYRSGPDIIVSGTATATLVVACSRCLEDISMPVQAELSLVMSELPADRDAAEDDLQVDETELGREYFQGDELVFDDVIRDHLLLELPMQPRCTDPPCPEWVKQYLTTAEEAEAEQAAKAAQQDVDPRMAALKALSGKLKGPKN